MIAPPAAKTTSNGGPRGLTSSPHVWADTCMLPGAACMQQTQPQIPVISQVQLCATEDAVQAIVHICILQGLHPLTVSIAVLFEQWHVGRQVRGHDTCRPHASCSDACRDVAKRTPATYLSCNASLRSLCMQYRWCVPGFLFSGCRDAQCCVHEPTHPLTRSQHSGQGTPCRALPLGAPQCTAPPQWTSPTLHNTYSVGVAISVDGARSAQTKPRAVYAASLRRTCRGKAFRGELALLDGQRCASFCGAPLVDVGPLEPISVRPAARGWHAPTVRTSRARRHHARGIIHFRSSLRRPTAASSAPMLALPSPRAQELAQALLLCLRIPLRRVGHRATASAPCRAHGNRTCVTWLRPCLTHERAAR